MRDQWAAQWPDLDTFPVGVVARVGRLARYFDHGLDQVFTEYGMRREHWDALASLRRAGPPFRLSPTDLYRGLMRTSGAMTNRLRRLEADGLIRRVPDPGDGRGLLVELTEKGRALVDEVAPVHVDNERAMLAALTPAEQQRFVDLLRKLLLSFEAGQGPPPRS
ncbi:MAG: MarR family winged helix-turn-helix transcriptional regulator [Trebonia sp.]